MQWKEYKSKKEIRACVLCSFRRSKYKYYFKVERKILETFGQCPLSGGVLKKERNLMSFTF